MITKPLAQNKIKLLYAMVALIALFVGLVAIWAYTIFSHQSQQSNKVPSPLARENIYTGSDARTALTSGSDRPFFIPGGLQGIDLVSTQGPDNTGGARFFLTSYKDGPRIITLTQVADGVDTQFIPAEADSKTSRTEQQIMIRGDKQARYMETKTESGSYNSLQWQESGWLITLESENADSAYLSGIAEVLTQQRQ